MMSQLVSFSLIFWSKDFQQEDFKEFNERGIPRYMEGREPMENSRT